MRMAKSKWARGVQTAANELLKKLEETGCPAAALTAEELWERLITPTAVPVTAQNRAYKFALLWSVGGCALICDEDIAERYGTPGEIRRLRRADGSLRQPNKGETWLELQARALHQAMESLAARRIVWE